MSAEQLIDVVSESVYNAAVAAQAPTPNTSMRSITTNVNNAHTRWEKVLSSKDSRQLWQSINWKGTFDTPLDCLETPSDDDFCEYFQNLLNPSEQSPDPPVLQVPDSGTYMPILDDPIDPNEIDVSIKQLKSNKAAGADGMPPGVLKLFNDEWILMVTFLFNMVFRGQYPLHWAIAKMFMIFKKGARLVTSNYRGISIINALAKLYDMVLNARLTKWYKPSQEQAGSQKGRGCEEQILTLRLLIDIARKTGRTLYVCFVDFEKAYDKVDRNKLLAKLASAGCGSTFLSAIAQTLKNTKSVIGEHVFSSSMGVRQGGATSCTLFTFYVDCIVQAISHSGPDDWLGLLHCLMQMDDTAVVATSRHKLIDKLVRLKRCSEDLGQSMHPVKSKFFNVNSDDVAPIPLGNVTVAYTENYVYLGTPMSNSPLTMQIQDHMSTKHAHCLKFTSFLTKNSDAPYNVKETVWQSALKSSLMFSCKTWLCTNLRPAEAPYMSSLKQLLGVRSTTCNDLALLESGVPSPRSYIETRQRNFLHKLVRRPGFSSSYVGHTMEEARRVRSPMGLRIQALLSLGDSGDQQLRTSVNSANSTRRAHYRGVNPSLSRHPMYSKGANCLEYARIATTRLRLSSHRLRVETGRWARIPREQRTCPCGAGDVQDESHVLLHCALSQDLRNNYPVIRHCSTLAHLFDIDDVSVLTKYCHNVLSCYQ